jgi:heme-binding protein
MTRAMTIRRTAFGLLAAGATCVALGVPAASADPVEPGEPVAPTPLVDSTEPGEPVVAPATPAADGCNAAGLAQTISSVTASLSTYFDKHPDVNQALIDATRQPAFVAVGQFDAYFNDHPAEADELRAIQAPLAAYQDRCGLQVSPTDALTVLSEV